jgi:hypothetical protein
MAFVTLEDCGGFSSRPGIIKSMPCEVRIVFLWNFRIRVQKNPGSGFSRKPGSEPDPFLSVASSRTAVNNDLGSNTVETLQN